MGVSKECRVGWAVASLQPWLSEQPQIALSAAIFSDLLSAAPAPGKIRGGTWALQGCGQDYISLQLFCDGEGMWQLRAGSSTWHPLPKTRLSMTCPPKAGSGSMPDICAESWVFTVGNDITGRCSQGMSGALLNTDPLPCKDLLRCTWALPCHCCCHQRQLSPRAAGIYSGESSDGMLPEMQRGLRPAAHNCPPHAGTNSGEKN